MTSTSVKPFVDTNVWVYAHDADEPLKRATALRLLDALPAVTISAQVMSEFYVTVTRKLKVPLPPAVAARQLQAMAATEVVAIDEALVSGATALSTSERISFWDALIVNAAVKGNCDALLTEDLADGRTIGGIRIRNPFA